ncbi:MAG: c-type cytochrome [Rhizobiaceae bacterium]
MAKHMVQFTLAALLTLAASPAFAEGDIKKGEKIFKKCRACHTVGEGAKIKLGPVLNNVFGATAGASADYASKYSKAMKKKGEEGLVWNAETLSDFLTKPKKYIKKTKMAFAGIKKEKQRENLLAYLLQYSPDYKPAE